MRAAKKIRNEVYLEVRWNDEPFFCNEDLGYFAVGLGYKFGHYLYSLKGCNIPAQSIAPGMV